MIELLADLPKLAERAVDRLEQTLGSGDVTRAREEIRSHVGTVTVEANAREFWLYSAQGVSAVLLRAVGGAHSTNVGSGGTLREFPTIASGLIGRWKLRKRGPGV